MSSDLLSLGPYAAKLRLSIFDDLSATRKPTVGAFDESVYREAQTKGAPQMGSTRFDPHEIHFEFIYADSQAGTTILTVTVPAPERIVHLPVPEWVIESIWQGEISGSYHFESHARSLLQRFEAMLEPEPNRALFGPQMAKRRE